MLVFSTPHVNYSSAPLTFSMVHLPPPPPTLPCVNNYTETRIQCVKGVEYGVLGLRQINTCREVFLLVNFLDDDILHCLL
jgi:hypothetical protein